MAPTPFTIPSFVSLTVTELEELLERSPTGVTTQWSADQAAAIPLAQVSADATKAGQRRRAARSILPRVALAGSLAALVVFTFPRFPSAEPTALATGSVHSYGQPAQRPSADPVETTEGSPNQTTAGDSLTREKENISKFLAQRHRKEPYQTEQIVHHAFDVAREMDLDPWLILAVISIESNLDPRAVSAKDARGLMQIHAPAHAEKFRPHGGIDMAFHPETNIRVGAGILRDYIDRYAGVPGALKAYVGAALLPHDEGYGAKVLAEQEQIAAAALGLRLCQRNDRSLCKPVVQKSAKASRNEASTDQQTTSRARQFFEAGAAGSIESINLLQ